MENLTELLTGVTTLVMVLDSSFVRNCWEKFKPFDSKKDLHRKIESIIDQSRKSTVSRPIIDFGSGLIEPRVNIKKWSPWLSMAENAL
jgi:hypothetical protein